MQLFQDGATPGRSARTKFLFLICGSLLCSAAYTLLQEQLYRTANFSAHGWLTFATFSIYALFGVAEMSVRGELCTRKGKLVDYAGVALLSVIAVYLTNVSLHTVPYTLKIVVKSCRVLPVMALSAAYQGKVYTTQQVVSACAMVAGVGLFFAGDWREAPHAQGEWTGVALLLAALVMDAVVANLEEGRFFRSVTPASRVEVMTYLSAFGALYSLVTLALSGELTTSAAAAPTQAMWVGIVVSALAGYGALGFMLALICAYGATAAEMVKTMRKVLQVSFSFLIFPKPLSGMHVAGSLVILASLWAFSRKPRQKAKESPKVADRLEASSGHLLAWKAAHAPFGTQAESFGVGMYLAEDESESNLQSGLTMKWSAA